jgi:hypothetical protein
MIMKKYSYFIILSSLIANAIYADGMAAPFALQPDLKFYAGIGAGYGDTNWDQLVNTTSPLVQTSAPDGATSGGMTFETFLGYKITPYFAIEGRFTRYPQATIHFAHLTWQSFNKDLPPSPIANPYGFYNFTTNTNAYAFVGKFIVPITPLPGVDAYADSGLNYTQRSDVLTNSGVYEPTFGAGIEWRFAYRFNTALEFEYVPGIGDTTELPATTYMPFLYDYEYLMDNETYVLREGKYAAIAALIMMLKTWFSRLDIEFIFPKKDFKIVDEILDFLRVF